MLLKELEEEVTYLYHPDHLGSVSVVSNHRGLPYERVEYLPFGEVWIEETDPATGYIPFRFTSKELDEETGLYYHGARYYEPTISRWMSADPAGFALSSPMGSDWKPKASYSIIEAANWYAYVSNNPVIYVDPTGKVMGFPGTKIRRLPKKKLDKYYGWKGGKPSGGGNTGGSGNTSGNGNRGGNGKTGGSGKPGGDTTSSGSNKPGGSNNAGVSSVPSGFNTGGSTDSSDDSSSSDEFYKYPPIGPASTLVSIQLEAIFSEMYRMGAGGNFNRLVSDAGSSSSSSEAPIADQTSENSQYSPNWVAIGVGLATITGGVGTVITGLTIATGGVVGGAITGDDTVSPLVALFGTKLVIAGITSVGLGIGSVSAGLAGGELDLPVYLELLK